MSSVTPSLPRELVLAILEPVARRWRDDNPRWVVSLQLISHAVRATLLPIIYRVFATDEFMLRDPIAHRWILPTGGRTFLSSLICKPAAAPVPRR